MFRSLALFFLVLLATVGSAAAADEQQQQLLGITVRGESQKIDRLDHYNAAQPVTIRVVAPEAARVVVAGAKPDGTPMRVALQRGADGTYTGTLDVPTPGTWILAAHTTIGGIETTTGKISMQVKPPPTHDDPTLMLVAALVSIGGGLGLIVIGRTTAAARSARPAA